MTVENLDQLKRAAALKAVDYVKDGMIIGLGTGSTAKHLVIALGEKVRAGMKLRGVPTSQETATLARQFGIALIDTDNRWVIDVAIDGADQVDPAFNLIKGGGGALLKEKIVAASAKQFIVVIDYTKRVPILEAPSRFPSKSFRSDGAVRRARSKPSLTAESWSGSGTDHPFERNQAT